MKKPLKDALGGIRMLYSHNVEFGLSSVREADRMSMDTIVRVLPALESMQTRSGSESSVTLSVHVQGEHVVRSPRLRCHRGDIQ